MHLSVDRLLNQGSVTVSSKHRSVNLHQSCKQILKQEILDLSYPVFIILTWSWDGGRSFDSYLPFAN